MSRYNYTDDELDLLKVLKMQEQQLHDLEKEERESAERIASVTDAMKELAARKGIDMPEPSSESDGTEEEKISTADIPDWESLVSMANEQVDYQPFIEDFLSQEEINYSLEEIEQIKKEFRKKTKLNKVDACFIVVATALQTLRWVIINKIMGDIGEKIDSDSRLQHNDKAIEEKSKERKTGFRDKHYKESGDNHPSDKGYKDWLHIIFDTVPYDAHKGAAVFDENMEGRYHRYRTLGHDPILGWIFGTANIITDTITLSNWKSYRIARVTPSGSKFLHFSEPTTLPTIFYESYDSIREDHLRLPAAIFTQFVHLESDAFTKQGLPVPILEAFSEKLAGKLYRSQYDSLCLMRDIKIVGTQAVISVIINMLVTLIHGLFYDEKKDESRDMYEVRTRKVLLYSNSLASAGNIAYSAATQDWGKLDVGGIIVTVTRLFSDIRFITRMKHEFIQKEMDKSLQEELTQIDKYFN